MAKTPQDALRQALRQLRSDRAVIDKKIELLMRAIDAMGEHHAPRRLRAPMSAAERRSVSARMKRYWASRRRAKVTAAR